MKLFWHLSYIEKVVKNLVFYIGVHIDEKKLLKRFVFSQKSETNLPSANSSGIAGIYLLWSKQLRIAQYVLGVVEEFWSLSVILLM